MSLCAYCGLSTDDPYLICSHHHGIAPEGDWATGNRIMCDFLHRGIAPPPAAWADRDLEMVDRAA